MTIANEILLGVTYGLGATVRTVVDRHALAGCTIREAVETALKAPHAAGSSEERAAIVIAEALRSRRPLDIEVACGTSQGVGQPVALDDILDRVLSDEHRAESTEGSAMEQEIRISLSEPYRGGDSR